MLFKTENKDCLNHLIKFNKKFAVISVGISGRLGKSFKASYVVSDILSES